MPTEHSGRRWEQARRPARRVAALLTLLLVPALLLWWPQSEITLPTPEPGAAPAAIASGGASPAPAVLSEAAPGAMPALPGDPNTLLSSGRNALAYASLSAQLAERLAHADGTVLADWYSLREEVRLACALVHRPDGSSHRVDLDAMRRPWLDALQQRCAGLPESWLSPPPMRDPARLAWRAQLPQQHGTTPTAALERARALLTDSADAALLHEALRLLLSQQALPHEQIWRGMAPPVSVDIEAALQPAADLAACQRSASCGPTGLWTLFTCAQLGCPPGADLDTALQWQLPQTQYQHARRIADWVMTSDTVTLQNIL